MHLIEKLHLSLLSDHTVLSMRYIVNTLHGISVSYCFSYHFPMFYAFQINQSSSFALSAVMGGTGDALL